MSQNDTIFDRAVAQNNIPVIEFMLNGGFVKNINATNSNNENVFHLLAKNVSRLGNSTETMTNALKLANKSIINQQDINGNTPILNMVGGAHPNSDKLSMLLRNSGADLTIKNNEGKYIGTMDTIGSTDFSMTDSDTEFYESNEPQLGGGVDEFSMISHGLSDDSYINSKFEKLYNDLSEIQPVMTDGNYSVNNDATESNNFFEKLITDIQNTNVNQYKNTDSELLGGNDNDLLNTEQIISILTGKNKQSGGADMITGTRLSNSNVKSGGSKRNHQDSDSPIIPDYDSDVNVVSNNSSNISGGNSTDDSTTYNSSNISGGNSTVGKFREYARQVSRLIDSQRKQTFEKVVKKIKDLLQVDDDTARFYKTTLIHMAKAKNPNLTGLELATTVDELATSDTLKKIDIEKEKKKIMEWRKSHETDTEKHNKSKDKKQRSVSDSSDEKPKFNKNKQMSTDSSDMKPMKLNKKIKDSSSDKPSQKVSKKIHKQLSSSDDEKPTKKVDKKKKSESGLSRNKLKRSKVVSDNTSVSEISLNDFSVSD